MQAIEILSKCRDAGIKLRVNGTRLKVLTQGQSVPPDLVALLKTHKEAVIAFLSDFELNRQEAPIASTAQLERKPLSYAQQRLWFLDRFSGPSAVYNMPMALSINGDVDEALLCRALEQVVARHDALRTRFIADGDEVYQHIDAVVPAIKIEPVSSEAELGERLANEQSHCFDLSTDALCKIRLFSLTYAQGYALCVTMHHSVSDGWSLGVFFRELVQIYGGLQEHGAVDLAPLPIQYADYANWQREWLSGDVLTRQLDYWRGQLEGLPDCLNLPSTHARPAEQSFAGAFLPLALDDELTRSLNALANANGTTLYMVLMAAFCALLSRYSGQRDIALGTPVANRDRKETEALIGFFVNTLVMRHRLPSGITFTELLEQTRHTSLDAYAHQDIPFEMLVDEINPDRSLSHSPLFQVMFALQNAPTEQAEAAGLSLAPLNTASGDDATSAHRVARFDLTLTVHESPEGLTGGFEYSTDLFARADIERMQGDYARFLRAVVAKPGCAVDAVDFLGDDDQRIFAPQRSTARAPDPVEATFPAAFGVVCDALDAALLPAGAAQTDTPPTLAYVSADQADLASVMAIAHAGGYRVAVLDASAPALLLSAALDALPVEVIAWRRGAIAPTVRATLARAEVATIDLTEQAQDSDTFEQIGPQAANVALTAVLRNAAGALDVVTLPASVWVDLGEVADAQGHTLAKQMLVGSPSAVPALEATEVSAGPQVQLRLVNACNVDVPTGACGRVLLSVEGDAAASDWVDIGVNARACPDGSLMFDAAPDAPARAAFGRALEVAGTRVLGATAARLACPSLARPDVAVLYLCADSAQGHCDDRESALATLRQQSAPLPLPHHIVVLSTWPRSADGLIEIDALPLPPALEVCDRPIVVAQTPTERTLVELWETCIGRQPISIDDNYFTLGGDSIRSIGMVADAQAKGLVFSVKDVFANPTIRALAAAIDAGQLGAASTASTEPFELIDASVREQLQAAHGPDALEDAYPLSAMQTGMILTSLRYRGLNLYENLQLYHVADRWDRDVFEQALGSVVARHPMMRVRFALDAEQPLQLIRATFAPDITVRDLSAGDAAAVDPALEAWMAEEKARGIDLAHEVWRCTVHVLPDDRFVFGLFVHHALWDGWSLESFVTEFCQAYRSLNQGQSLPALPAPPPFRDFIALESSARASDAQKAHWLDVLDQAKAPWWTATARGSSAALPMDIDADLSARLSQLAARLNVQEKSVWCAAYMSLLSLLNGSDRVAGAVITQGRPEVANGEQTIGVHLNALPIVAPLAGQTWADYVCALDAQLREQHAHRFFPVSDIQRLADIDLSGSGFNYTNWHVYQDGVYEQTQASDDSVEVESTGDVAPQKVGGFAETEYKLFFDITKDERVGRFGLSIKLDDKAFDANMQARVPQYMANILAGLADDADAVIDKSALIPAGERSALVDEWNQTELVFDDAASLAEQIARRAEQHPERIALVAPTPHGEYVQLTYGELERRASAVALRLVELGLAPEARVGICTTRSVNMLLGIVGTLKAGGTYVGLDPTYPKDRLRFMIEDSACAVLLSESAIIEGTLRDIALTTNHLIALDHASWQGEGSYCAPISARQVAYMVYTSGSTGRPKGVQVEHRSALSLVAWAAQQIPWTERSDVAATTSMCFDLSVYEMFLPLCTGATCVVFNDALAFGGSAQKWRPTLLNTVPSAASALLDQQAVPDTIRVVNCAGEPLRAALVDRLYEETSAAAVHDLFGPSETTVYSTFKRRERGGAETIGRPLANTAVYVLDDSGAVCPTGVSGELHIAGAGVARAYHDRPALTAERFVPDPFATQPGARMYRTGDLVRYLPATGTAPSDIAYLGRLDNQIKIRGFRVELGEIEVHLARHDHVKAALVMAERDALGQARLVAFVESLASVEGSADLVRALKSDLAQRMPAHAVPGSITVCAAFPTLPNGKIDRQALRALESPTVDATAAPETPEEAAICSIWEAALGAQRIGRDDNFFERGGHSLLVVHVLAELRKAGYEASAADLFNQPTPREFALTLRSDAGVGQAVCAAPTWTATADDMGKIAALTPGGADNVQAVYPLGPLQEGLLYIHRRNDGRDPFVLSIAQVQSEAEVARLIDALNFVIGRHDALRTAIHWRELSEPLQVVQRAVELPVARVALDAEGDVEQQLAQIRDDRAFVFDLQRAPLVHLTVATQPDSDRAYVVIRFHHIVIDHVSIQVLQQEMDLWHAGQHDTLTEPAQYGQFIAAVRNDTSADAAKAFFKALLGNVEEATLPYELAPSTSDGSRIVSATREMDPELSARLREHARTLRVAPSAIFHAAYASVIGRLSRRTRVVFGTVLSGRLQSRVGTDDIVGMFINTLPVCVDVSEPRAAERIGAVQEALQSLLAFEHAPLALAQNMSAVPNDEPLFSSVLNYRYSHRDSAAAAQRAEHPNGFAAEMEGSSYPITVAVNDWSDDFSLSALVDPSIDPDQLLLYLERALERLVAQLDAPESRDADWLPDAELAQLHAAATGAASPPVATTVPEQIRARAAATPDAVALVDGSAQITYRELQARAQDLSQRLLAAQVQPDERVIVCLPRSADLVIAMLGVLGAGAAYVAIDPELVATRVADIVKSSAARIALTYVGCAQAETLGRIAMATLVHGRADALARDAVEHALPELHRENAAYVVYTSGSTGRPKGVIGTHGSLAHRVDWALREVGLHSDHVCAQKTGVGFVDHVAEIFQGLCAGARLVIVASEALTAPADFEQICRDQRLSHITLVPSLISVLARGLTAPIETLEVVFSSGEALAEHHRAACAQVFGRAQLYNVYGSTEVGADALAWAAPATCDAPTGSAPIGEPLPNVACYALDADLRLAPLGVLGQLFVAGPGLARGYCGDARRTAEMFVPDPFATVPGRRMYATGDVGRVGGTSGGREFCYAGRMDDQVKIRGVRIEPGEIEHALREQDAVRDVVVMAKVLGPAASDATLIAYLVPEDGRVVDDEMLREELIDQLRRAMAGVLSTHLQPTAFVCLSELPRTLTGKLDRRALPEVGQDLSRPAFESASGETEIALVAYWEALLDDAPIGRHDNFFQRGGHSILVTQLAARIRSGLGVELPLADVFAYPTVAGQAARIDALRADGAAAAPIPLADRQGPLPLSFAQRRMWFLNRYSGPSAVYNMPLALSLKGDVDIDALRSAVRDVQLRHETLRTAFVADGQAVWQRIAPDAAPLKVEQVETEADLRAIAASEATYAFDLCKDALCRVRLIACGETGEHALLFTMHHAISDGWSLGVLFADLMACYRARHDGSAPRLTPLAIQYADFAVWQRDHLRDEVLRHQVEYWSDALDGMAERLDLPTDRPRPVRQTFVGATCPIELSAPTARALRGLAADNDATLFMVLFAAFGVLMGRYSEQDDFGIGTPVANRTRQETEPLIGFFVNSLVMRCDLTGGPTFAELIARVRDRALGAYAHQDVPFEKLIDELCIDRRADCSPLYQVMFALQNTPQQRAEMAGADIAPLTFDQGTSKIERCVARFDLTLNMQEIGQGIAGEFEYNVDLFDAASIEQLAQQYVHLLEAVVRAPQTRVHDFGLCPPQDRARIDALRAAQDAPAACEHPLDVLDDTVHSAPDTIVCAAPMAADQLPTSVSAVELTRRSIVLANQLAQCDIEARHTVAIVASDAVSMAVAAMGIARAGANAVVLDKALPALALARRIEISGAHCAVVASETDAALVSALPYVVLSACGARLAPSDPRPTRTAAHSTWLVSAPDGALRTLTAKDLASLANAAPDQVPAVLLGSPMLPCERLVAAFWSALGRGHVFDGKAPAWPLPQSAATVTNIANAKVVDAAGNPTGFGQPGELLVSAPSAGAATRAWRTGLRARWAARGAGLELHVLSRRSRRGRVGSVRPDLSEAVVRAGGVLDAVSIVGVDSVTSYVQPQVADVDPLVLRASLVQSLRRNETLLPLPDVVAIVAQIPRTESGQPDRARLIDATQRSTRDRDYAAPASGLEARLADLWAAQLDVPDVSVTANYFSLGGDSIRSIGLVSAANDAGFDFSIKDLFAFPTVRELARAIEAGHCERQAHVEVAAFSLLSDAESAALDRHFGLENLQDAYPMSVMQQGMVLTALKASELNLYENVQMYHFHGAWDEAAFVGALTHLVEAHDLLRSVHYLDADRPLQVIPHATDIDLNVVDLRGCAASEVDAALSGWIDAEKARGLDTTCGLWRATVHRVTDDHVVFGMFVHHAVWDGWSLESFVAQLYAAVGAAASAQALPEVPAHPGYQAFVALEQKALACDQHKAFWAERLAAAKLPWWADRPRSVSHRIQCPISEAMSARALMLARELSVQEKSVWCTVYLALVNMLAGEDATCAAVATQGRPEVDGGDKTVGVFVNALPTGLALGRSAWAEAIVKVDTELRQQHAFRRYPLAQMQLDSGLDFSAALFNYTNWHVYYETAQSDLGANASSAAGSTPDKLGGWAETDYLFLMDVSKDERSQAFRMEIGLDASVFDLAWSERIQTCVANILEQLLGDVEQRVDYTAMLGSSEIQQQLVDWNPTERALPAELDMAGHFAAQVARAPDAVAIVERDLCLTYGELDVRARGLANALRAQGAGPDVAVGVCVSRSAHMLTTVLAVTLAGAAYVPLDADYPAERLASMLELSGVQVIVADVAGGNAAPNLSAAVSRLPVAQRPVLLDARCADAQSVEAPVDAVHPDNLAYVVFTSGSTGVPKGCAVTQRNVLRLVDADFLNWDEVDTMFCGATVSFDAITFEMWCALLRGKRLVLADVPKLSFPKLGALLSEQAVDSAFLTTALFNQILNDSPVRLKALRNLLVGGEAMSRTHARMALDALPNARFQNVYGPTENTTFTTAFDMRDAADDLAVIPIGYPITHSLGYVMTDDAELVAAGVPGEFVTGGLGVARGYVGRPALTAERFLPDPYAKVPGARMYATGDRMRLSVAGSGHPGALEFLERIDHQVKFRGFRIELGEIEQALRQHTGVADAFVMLDGADEQAQLLGYVASADATSAPTASELRAWLQTRLPAFMQPSAVMVLPALPLTSNGKVDRKALPRPDRAALGVAFVAPHTIEEKLLAELWESLLKRSSVGRHDNFFECGGHSLLVTQLASRIRDAFDVDVSIKDLFECATLDAQAQCIENARRNASTTAPALVPRAEDAPPAGLSYAQQRLWFLNEFNGPNAIYNMPLALCIRGDLNVAALGQALQTIVDRHAILRSHFVAQPDGAVQVVEDMTVELGVEVVTSSQELQRLCDEERLYPFDLAGDPLLRLRLFQLQEDNSHLLHVNIHHVAADGWSLGVFFSELVAAYAACDAGREPELAPVSIQYADFADWQRRALTGELLQEQTAYWQQELQGLPGDSALPTTFARPAAPSYRGGFHPIFVPEALLNELLGLGQRHGVTLYMTLVAAFSATLSRLTGQGDVALGTPIANRHRREIENTIGFFVNTQVLRCDTSDDPTFATLLHRVRRASLDAHANQDLPFEHLVETLNPERSEEHSPLFQVMFALQNAPMEQAEVDGLDIRTAQFEEPGAEGVSRFDMTVSLQETPAGLTGGVEYSLDLFDEATVGAILDRFVAVLGAVAKDVTLRCRALPLVAGQSDAACESSAAVDARAQLDALLASKPGSAAAVVLGESSEQYAPLGVARWQARALDVASALTARSFNESSCIALGLSAPDEFLIAAVGIMLAGHRVVAVPADTPALLAAWLLEASDAAAVVADDAAPLADVQGVERLSFAQLQTDAAAEPADAAMGPVGGWNLVLPTAAGPRVFALELAALLSLATQGDATPGGLARSLLGMAQRFGALEDLPADWQRVCDDQGHAVAALIVGRHEVAIPGCAPVPTGYRARVRADGVLEVLDDRAVSLTSPSELNALAADLEACDSVTDVAVHIPGADAVWCVQWAESSCDATSRRNEVLRALRERPKLAPLPSVLVDVGAIATLASGRVDFAKLPIPQKNRRALAPYVAPKTPTQTALVAIFEQRLGVDRVGINDNYFDLGGDSIRSIGLVNDAREQGLDCSVKDLFRFPSVAQLAHAIEEGLLSDDTLEAVEPFELLTDDERQAVLQASPGALEDAYPLAMLQQGMVLLSMRQRELNLYENIQIYEFEDEWDSAAMENSLAYLIEKHPLLRSRYLLQGQRPIQMIQTEWMPRTEIRDLRECSDAQAQREIQDWMQQELAAGIDTTQELWRVGVHLLPGRRFAFGMCVHHALWDGWSLESFVAELYARYAQYRQGDDPGAPERLPSYNLFVANEIRAIESQTEQDYWTSYLEDAATPWWCDGQKTNGAVVPCNLSRAQYAGIEATARRLSVQEKSVWCAVYLALLSALNGRDGVVGPVATQGRPEIDGGDRMLGVFLNVLPLRVGMDGLGWADFIRRVDEDLRRQHAHRHFPLSEVQRLTGTEMSGSLFNYTNWHVYHEADHAVDAPATDEPVADGADAGAPVPNKMGGFSDTNYRLLFDVHKNDLEQSCSLVMTADEGVFDLPLRVRLKTTVDAIITDLLADDAARTIDRNRMIGAEDRSILLESWNRTQDHADAALVHERFEAWAQQTPDAVALSIRDADGLPVQVSYGWLDGRANQVAHALRAQGAGPEFKVGLCFERSMDVLIAIVATFKAGAAYVPLDPRNPTERLDYIVSDSGVTTVLGDRASRERVADSAGCQCLNWLLIDAPNALVDGQPQTRPEPVDDNDPSRLAYIIYTSGSTGKPKGVLVEQRNVARLFETTSSTFGFCATDVWSLFHSYAFDFSVWELWGALAFGGRVAVVPDGATKATVDFYDLLVNERVTLCNQTPTSFYQLDSVDAARGESLAIRHVIFGGEALNESRLRSWMSRHGDQRIALTNMYGITETTVHVTAKRLTADGLAGAARSNIGRKLNDLSLYVLGDDQRLLPVGVPGEIYVGGAGVTRGYLNRPELTAQRFVDNPYGPGRLYRTGDVARFTPHGDLEYIGRSDHQVNIRGFRIELGEIEAALLSYATVTGAVVLAPTDADGMPRLVAYVEVGSASEAAPEQADALRESILAHVQTRVPGYMVPSAVVLLDAFPTSIGGKVDYRALLLHEVKAMQAAYVAPDNDIQAALCEFWQHLFGIERVGIHDNFWRLGGHSLLVLQVFNFMTEHFDVQLSMDQLFEAQTVEDFSALVETARDAATFSAARARIADEQDEDMELEDGVF